MTGDAPRTRNASDELTVPPDVADLVRAQLDQGHYASSGDVLREAMRALEQRSRLRALRAKVEASLDDPRPPMTAEEVRTRLRHHARTRDMGDHA